MKTAKMMAIVAALVFGMTFGLGGAAQAGTITLGDPLIPAGLVGDTFHLLFVTTTTRDANSSDMGVYNSFVNTAAELTGSLVEGYGFTWYAVASVGLAPAGSPNVANVNAFVSAPVYTVSTISGLSVDLVAIDYADIWDGSISNYIRLFTGADAATVSARVWTGSAFTGIAYGNGSYTLGGAHPGEAEAAKTNILTEGWMGVGGQTWNKNNVAPLYALSEPLTIAVPVPEPAGLGLVGIALLAVRRKRS